jgi:hypothetical protein
MSDGGGIVTNRGVFILTGGSEPCVEPSLSPMSSATSMLACKDDMRIMAAGRDLLWLPSECLMVKWLWGKALLS